MRELKASTKRGQDIISRADSYIGYNLQDVYTSYSNEKALAYQWCVEQCLYDEGDNFHICSKNTFGFTCAWDGVDEKNGRFIRYETKDNSYIVWLDK